MLQIKSLSCSRGRLIIFRDLSLELNSGDALMIVGANGSGKSSLLRIISGLLSYKAGTINWNGLNIADNLDEYRSNLCYIGHLDSIKQELTVAENFDYWRAICGVDNYNNSHFYDPFKIFNFLDKPARYLSVGQKRRLALSRLFLGNSKLWLLDEPTTALDREGQSILLDCIGNHRQNGGIVIIATHHEIELDKAKYYQMGGKTPK